MQPREWGEERGEDKRCAYWILTEKHRSAGTGTVGEGSAYGRVAYLSPADHHTVSLTPYLDCARNWGRRSKSESCWGGKRAADEWRRGDSCDINPHISVWRGEDRAAWNPGGTAAIWEWRWCGVECSSFGNTNRCDSRSYCRSTCNCFTLSPCKGTTIWTGNHIGGLEGSRSYGGVDTSGGD